MLRATVQETTPSRLILVTEGLDGQDGGVQRVSRSVLAALLKDDVLSLVWSSNDVRASGSSAPGDQVRVRCFGRRYAAMAIAALFSRDLPASCRKIFCWHLALAPVAMLLSKRLGCPYEVFLHGVEAWRTLSFRQRASLRFAHAITANSQYTLERFRSTHPEFGRKPGEVIGLGLSSEFVAAAPSPGGLNSPRPYFLVVARLAEDYKGEQTLLDALAELHRKHPEARLVCVGEGPRKAHWKEYARAIGVGEAVDFAGHMSDSELAALYAGCRAFVLLSEGEGFGIVFLEAMYHGKPCIATDADASRELVRDGVTGLVVPPRNIVATAGAMRRLIEDPDGAARLGKAGKEMVMGDYLPEHFQRRLMKHMAV